MKKQRTTDPDTRKMRMRLRWIQHYQHVTRNVCQTCRYFGVSRSLFYYWMKRYRESDEEGLYSRPPDPRHIIHRTPPQVVNVILQIRREKHYGALRTSWYLQKHYQNLRLQRDNPANLSQTRGATRNRSAVCPPQQAAGPSQCASGRPSPVGCEVFAKAGTGTQADYQFTAIDACTRYRVLQIYSHNSAKSAVDFIERVRQKLPCVIKEIQTDHGSEFGTRFTWHLNDLGITHRRIAPGCPEQNGKVERSHRTDEEEFYRQHQFQDEQELKTRLEAWEREYNFERPHMGLGGIPPAQRMHQKLLGKNLLSLSKRWVD